MKDFSGWTPMRIYWRGPEPMVDWGHLGARRFVEPFFAQTMEQCVRHPADLLFRHQTPLSQLGEIAGSQPSMRPAGFIFHMSRCGSTLISQMLAAAPQNIVLSEPGPIDTVLRACFREPRISADQAGQWLQWLVAIWAWRRNPEAKNVFLKFDCWHALFLPLIQRAFPGVPWIFVYREPVEVMASHLKQRGGQMIPGVLEPGVFGWDLRMAASMNINEYGARVLARVCAAALAQSGNGKLVNYRQLPAVVWPALLEYWHVDYSAEETARMLGAAQQNAKNPKRPFATDSQTKRDSTPADVRALTEYWLGDVFQQLEAQRLAHGLA